MKLKKFWVYIGILIASASIFTPNFIITPYVYNYRYGIKNLCVSIMYVLMILSMVALQGLRTNKTFLYAIINYFVIYPIIMVPMMYYSLICKILIFTWTAPLQGFLYLIPLVAIFIAVASVYIYVICSKLQTNKNKLKNIHLCLYVFLAALTICCLWCMYSMYF